MALKLDQIDISILAHLQKNARISDKDISRNIHLSPNAVAARIKRLEDENYIQHYTTVLNKSKVNRNLECFTGINLTQNNYQTVNAFLKFVNGIPEIYRFYRINSMFDFLLHIVSIDIQDYHHLLIDKLTKINCVSSATPFVVLNEAKSLNIIDLSHLFKRFER